MPQGNYFYSNPYVGSEVFFFPISDLSGIRRCAILAEYFGVGLELSRRSSVFAFDLYLVFNNMDHDKKIKQMRLCADFNAGPSKEQPLFFLFYLKRTSVAVFFFQSLIQAAFLGVQSQAEHVGVELELSRRSSVFTFDY